MKKPEQVNPNIDNLVKNLDPESQRMRLIESAIRFKSNWVEFGEFLTKVAAEKQFEEWGYKKFEDYCWNELRIKRNTAMKLTNAYFFMSHQEPEIFQQSKSTKLPDLDTVGVLQKAKSDIACSDEMYEEIRDSALVKGQAASTVARKYKELSNINSNRSEEDDRIEQSLNLVARLRNKLVAIPGVHESFGEYLSEMEEFLNSVEVQQPDE